MQKAETLLKVNNSLLNAQYAVRGQLPQMARRVRESLAADPGRYRFDSVLDLSLGNPMAFGHKYTSFNRQVMDLVLNPWRAHPEKTSYHPDAVKRAQFYISKIGPSVGAYAHPKGFQWVRERVGNFVNERDGLNLPITSEHVLMSNGAAPAVAAVMAILVEDQNSGVMIQTPQFPLYSTLLAIYSGREIPFYLDEEKRWAVSVEELERAHSQAVAKGIKPRALVAINPGNPTGQVMEESTIEGILKFCNEKNMVCLADEVYQKNIYAENKKFVSFRKVLSGMDKEVAESQELVSLHSASKGLSGECGKI